MIIRIRKEYIFSLLVFLPYLEGLLGFLGFFKNGVAYYRPINFILFFLAIIVVILGIKYKPIALKLFKIELLLPLYLMLSLFWTSINDVTWSTLTWMITPIFFAVIFSSYLLKDGLNINTFIKYCIINFCLYSFVNLVHNIISYHLFIDLGVRMRSAGGGAVIYGYTALIFFAFLCAYNFLFTRIQFFTCCCILVLTILGTGSRGAIWPLIPVIILHVFLSRKNSKGTMIFFLIFIPIFFAFFIISPLLLMRIAPRLLEATDYSRNLSNTSAAALFLQSDNRTKLLGRGIGNVFIYQKWILQNFHVADSDRYPFFSYFGRTLLVQPHNVYYYYLLEVGLIAFILFILPFIKYFILSYKRKNIWLFTLSILFLVENHGDSIMIVEPGVAAVLYTLIFVMANSQLYNNIQEIS